MSVNVGNRTPSKYEYINAYYRVDNDVLELCRNVFGVYVSQPKLTRDEIISNFEGGNYKCIT